MKLLVTVVISLLFGEGCSSHIVVYPENSHQNPHSISTDNFNREISDKNVQIYLQDGTTISGSQFHLGPDSASFKDLFDSKQRNVSTRNLNRVERSDQALGILMGGLAGAGLGVVFGWGPLLIISDSWDNMVSPVATGGFIGSSIGLVCGGIEGYVYSYDFSKDSTRTSR